MKAETKREKEWEKVNRVGRKRCEIRAGRWNGHRWMEKKSAAERQDNFLIFQSVARQTEGGCREVERDRVTEKKRRTAGDKKACRSEGGKKRRGRERVHRDTLCTDTRSEQQRKCV